MLSTPEKRALEIIHELVELGGKLVKLANRAWIAFLPLIIAVVISLIKIKRGLSQEPIKGDSDNENPF